MNNDIEQVTNINEANNEANKEANKEASKKVNKKTKYNRLDKDKYKDKDKDKEEDVIVIPTFDNYNAFLNHKFNIAQLKSICKHYKQPVTGNKLMLTNIIYKYLFLSHNASVIQRVWRKSYYMVYSKLRGPARFNRKICVNETDFFTMDDLKSIPFKQFFSFKDTDNMVYGFDIMSLHNLFISNDKLLNPYTRNPINMKVRRNFNSILYFSKILKDPIQLDANEEPETTENLQNNNTITHDSIVTRAVNLFHDIDILGNYTNPMWFLELQKPQLLLLFRELFDIWSYRSQLSEQVKNEICPNGFPFLNIHLYNLSNSPLKDVQFSILGIMETMTRSGINQHSKYLGSTYVLCALTLVNTSAADALPWLYESVI